MEDFKLMAQMLGIYCASLGFDIVDQCESYRSGLQSIREKRPEIILIDISLPDGDGLELTRLVLSELPEVKILATSSYRDPWTMLRLQRSGAHGFIDKNEPIAAASTAFESVLNGECFLPRIAELSCSDEPSAPTDFGRLLSASEIEILSLIGTCRTNEAIAAELLLSPSTVQSRRRDIMRKLNIHSAPQLIKYALVNGITRFEHFPGDNG